MAFAISNGCPLRDERKCDGKQKKNEKGQVINACAFCQTTKKRLLGLGNH